MIMGSSPQLESDEQGFRYGPHGTGWVIEAWGPDRSTCLAESVGGLVAIFAAIPDAAATTSLPVVLEAAPGPDLVVALLEEVIDTIDVFGKVPVHVHLAEAEDGSVAGDLEVVDIAGLRRTGPVPRAASWHGLEFGESGGTWRCRVVVETGTPG
ncbi:MAG TPA: archease [Acidimicrobiales bacterium]|nr:archease [Acidimicrobiales bacterium]